MTGKTYAALAVAADVQDADLLASFRGGGPLKSLRADLMAAYVATKALSVTQTISVNTAATAADYLILRPTDAGVGKPSFIFSKEASALLWKMRLDDGASVAGQLDVALTLLNFTGNMTVNGTLTLVGTSATPALSLLNAIEPTTISATAATGTINLYPAVQSILFYTANSAANWTVNLAFSSGTPMNTALSVGQSIIAVHKVTNGVTPHFNNVVQVDGTTTGVTTIWQAAAPTAGTASAVDVYSYEVLKTGSATFTVFASQVPFR